jgi:hypothetical protein
MELPIPIQSRQQVDLESNKWQFYTSFASAAFLKKESKSRFED